MQITKYHITGLIVILMITIFGLISLNSGSITGFFGQDYFVSKSSNVADKNPQSAKVVRVVDGDTVELENGITVRYLNMDTPETKKPSTPVMCYGKQASEKNSELVKNQTVWLKADKEDADRYGRKLRFIFLNQSDTSSIEKSVNAQLVRDGFARTMIIKPNTTYEKVFKSLEYEAKTNKIGLWGTCEKPFEV